MTDAATERPLTRQPLSPVAAGRTDQGPVRDHNEDAFAINPGARIFAVADGMGGHSRGDYAAALMTRAIAEAPALPDPRAQLQDLVSRTEAVNGQLKSEAAAAGASAIGCTLSALLVAGEFALFAWIGDSRGYHLRDGVLQRTTKDHSVVQALIDRGQLAPEEAESHPHAHVLTRAVGAAEKAEFEFAQVQLRRGDRALLCSDGLTRTLTDEELGRILAGDGAPQQIADALIEEALRRKAQDNVTALVLEMV